MLFVFENIQEVYFVMRDMEYPLDIIFIDKHGYIVNIEHGEVGSKSKYYSNGEVKYVLELNKGKASEYKKGDSVGLSCRIGNKVGEQKIKELKAGGYLTESELDGVKVGSVMYKDIKPKGVDIDSGGFFILNDDREAYYKIRGNERVYSIENTEEIIESVIKVDGGDMKEEDLGRLMVGFIDNQHGSKGQYVKAALKGMRFLSRSRIPEVNPDTEVNPNEGNKPNTKPKPSNYEFTSPAYEKFLEVNSGYKNYLLGAKGYNEYNTKGERNPEDSIDCSGAICKYRGKDRMFSLFNDAKSMYEKRSEEVSYENVTDGTFAYMENKSGKVNHIGVVAVGPDGEKRFVSVSPDYGESVIGAENLDEYIRKKGSRFTFKYFK